MSKKQSGSEITVAKILLLGTIITAFFSFLGALVSTLQPILIADRNEKATAARETQIAGATGTATAITRIALSVTTTPVRGQPIPTITSFPALTSTLPMSSSTTQTPITQSSRVPETNTPIKMIVTPIAVIPTATQTPRTSQTIVSTASVLPTSRPTGNCADPGARFSFSAGEIIGLGSGIKGTARAPMFAFYQIEYHDPSHVWRQLGSDQNQQRQDEILAIWRPLPMFHFPRAYADTPIIFLRLTVYLTDGTSLASCQTHIHTPELVESAANPKE